MRRKKLTVNKIIVFLFTLFCILVLAAKLPCSYVVLTFEMNGVNNDTSVVLSGNAEDGVMMQQESRTAGETFSFSMIDYYPVSDLSVDLEAEGITINSVTMSSRDHVVYQWGESRVRDSIVYCNTEEGKTSIAVSEEMIKTYNQIYASDWRLKLDILAPVVCAFICLELIYLLWVKAKPNRRQTWMIAAAVLVSFAFYWLISNTAEKTYGRVTTGVEAQTVTAAITEDEVYEQSFCIDKKVYGLSLRFATHDKMLSGDYILRVHDGRTGNVVLEKTISGKTIQDNKSQDILFDTALEANTEYRFCITAEEETDELLVIWRSETDLYDSGSLYVDGTDSGSDLDFSLIVKGPNRVMWIMSFTCLFLIIAGTALFYHRLKIPKILAALIIYGLTFIFCLMKMSFYYQHFDLGTYDEMAQVSYIAYLEKEDAGLIPEFENMTLLMDLDKKMQNDPQNVYSLSQTKGEFAGKFTGTVNYLGHPPLYYQLMRLTGSITFEGDAVYVDLFPLRMFNMVIVASAILLMFYIGLTRIKKNPPYHMLFAFLCTSVPMLCYEACMISNDNLTLLAAVIFMLGGIRFTEGKLGMKTYFMIAAGICIAVLTKTTAGLLVLLAAVIFLVWTICREKNLRLIINWHFAVTIPLYLLTAAYFLAVHRRYGTFQPSLSSIAYEQYIQYPWVYEPLEERVRLEFWEFAWWFRNTFIAQWKQGVAWQNNYGGWANIGAACLWIAPFIYLIKVIREKTRTDRARFFVSMIGAVWITVSAQFIRAFKDVQYISGHGGMQSRYYICIVLFFAFILIELLSGWFGKNKRIARISVYNGPSMVITKEKIGIAVCIIYCAILVYADIMYNMMNSVKFTY